MIGYMPKDEKVAQRALKVQSLSIPLKIVGNATAASVVPSNDEPALMFIQTAGVDQITPALKSGETATFVTSPVDSTGVFNVLVHINENVGKVVSASLVQLDGLAAQLAKLGSATGVTTGSAGGQSIMVTCDCSADLTSATFNGCLKVDYITAQ